MRLIRFSVASVAGIAVGVVLGIAVAVAIIVLAINLFSTSETDRVRHEVQSQFGKVAHVDSCRKISVDSADQDEYRCEVTTTVCRRSYTFAIAHEFGEYAATPFAKSDRIFIRPCSVPSDS